MEGVWGGGAVMYLENLFKRRPVGCESKNDIGILTTCRAHTPSENAKRERRRHSKPYTAWSVHQRSQVMLHPTNCGHRLICTDTEHRFWREEFLQGQSILRS